MPLRFASFAAVSTAIRLTIDVMSYPAALDASKISDTERLDASLMDQSVIARVPERQNPSTGPGNSSSALRKVITSSAEIDPITTGM